MTERDAMPRSPSPDGRWNSEAASRYLPWFQMVLGMAEYRSGHFAEAEAALKAAADNAKLSKDLGAAEVFYVSGTSAFYRAMGLFRQGKKDEAKKLATEAAAKMVPLPKDELNPLSGGAGDNDLVLWLGLQGSEGHYQVRRGPRHAGQRQTGNDRDSRIRFTPGNFTSSAPSDEMTSVR